MRSSRTRDVSLIVGIVRQAGHALVARPASARIARLHERDRTTEVTHAGIELTADTLVITCVWTLVWHVELAFVMFSQAMPS
jgi:hypothetical protein